MPTRSPTPADFPSHLTVTITPPPSQPSTKPTPNILLLLHGLGDTASSFTAFARALNLPETTCVTLQAPHPLPLDLAGFHWGDDVAFDQSTGGLDMDAGFARATRVIVDEVVRGVLVRKCGYRLREVLVLGFGQGGMVGLVAARELGKVPRVSDAEEEGKGDKKEEAGELAGVISIGAPYPHSGSVTGPKNRTPVLLLAGRDSAAVTDSAVQRTRNVFEFVEIHRWARKGDGMPRNREEMMPVMQFFARRLRSMQGVPEGAVEIT
ncbi:Phospholipase/Carboxylesterase superfamily [Thermoascus aurantiacus ATCC 26904]